MPTPSLAAAFAELLIAARSKAGLTQEELGDRAGLDRATISQFEIGKASPRLETLIRLAGGLGVDPCSLIPPVRWEPSPEAVSAPTGKFIDA